MCHYKNHLDSRDIKKIDYFVTTHPHEDHIGSAAFIVSNYIVRKIYAPKVSANTKTFESFLNAVKKKNLKITSPVAGSFILDDKNKLSIQILAPNSSNYSDLNTYSIVLKVKYNKTSFLLTGDATTVSEAEMIRKGYDLKADVLKVGHHGSPYASSQEFLLKVKPKYAVISVGKGNVYGHPASTTLSKLKGIGAQVCRTDEVGTIFISSDGIKISIDKKASAIKENAPPVSKNVSSYYIGNKNSHVFHLPSCRSLPKAKNQVIFKTREKAVSAGYKPCGLCRP